MVEINSPNHFNPHFNEKILKQVFKDDRSLFYPDSLEQLQLHMEKIAESNQSEKLKSSSSGNLLFDADDEALLNFLNPKTGGGPQILRPYMIYHDSQAEDCVKKIIKSLEDGKTVILDLGNASDEIRKYFSDLLSKAIFAKQEEKFTNDNLKNHFIQLYFEEAHNLFPKDDKDLTGVYSRFAKEGAKFHIGMVYSTQSPSTINKELLAQTENFFVAHMSSQDEAHVLAKLQVQFDGLQHDILHTRTPGYMRIITFSHRFVIPVQINKFKAANNENQSTGEVREK